jgi:molybdopterin synthase sulfur carrier subunit
MQVTLLFFAAARDAVGRSKDVVELPSQVDNVAKLMAWLGGHYPSLEPYLPCVRIAQNEHFVESSTAIQAGDTLAVIPPVAGG